MSLLVRFIAKNVRPHPVLARSTWNPAIPIRNCHRLSPLMRPVPSRTANINTLMIKRTLSSAAAHDHTKIWVVEKVVSASLLVVIPAALLYPNPILDYLLALSLVMHIHWGLEAMVVDYIRPSLFGNAIPKVAMAATYLLSMVALAGLFYLNYSDVGTATAIKMFAQA